MSSSNAKIPKEAAEIFHITFGVVMSQCLYVAAELGIADYLAHGPLSVQSLASKTGTHADALSRLLRSLVAFGILKHDCEDKFLLTPTGDLLRTDVPGSLRSTVMFLLGPWNWRPWEYLSHSIRTGRPAFDHAWGISNFEYWANNPEISEIHDKAMAGATNIDTSCVLGLYDFSRFGKVVDVGGGNGAFLAEFLRQHPKATAILVDLPHVVTQVSSIIHNSGVIDRCEVIGCNFFEAVPPGGDLYILKHVICDWDDDRARQILRNCHSVMCAGARLLIIDCVLSDKPTTEATMGYIADMALLVQTSGGRERTQQEFHRLLESAGFELTRVIKTGSLTDILEARKRGEKEYLTDSV